MIFFRLTHVVEPNPTQQNLAKVLKYHFSLAEIPVSNFYPVKIAFFGARLLYEPFAIFCLDFIENFGTSRFVRPLRIIYAGNTIHKHFEKILDDPSLTQMLNKFFNSNIREKRFELRFEWF